MPDPTEWLRAELRQTLGSCNWSVLQREVGWIEQIGDGVGTLRGAPSVRAGELLDMSSGLTAMAFDIRHEDVGILFLDPSNDVAAGDNMSPTGRVASVVVTEELLGRVVDSLGRPLDGGPEFTSFQRIPIEREAPGVVDRVPVHEPLHTGIKAIDALLPIGRGQRELILGDRSTGKTAIAVDTILAQANTGVICIYVAIGKGKSSVGEVIELLTANQAMPYTIVVVSDADSPPGQQYIAPYSGCSIGEYFMRKGRHVLIVYDDLSNHADAYRRISLLMRRPPGREAYPPDVFYLHARLLERATRLNDSLGGGSLTALPIATTQSGHISAFIPTNLISITDGQIYLDKRLFNEGQLPAIDVGLSVSRVGAKAQPAILRGLAGDLKLLYAQLHELETFARFGAELEPESRIRLIRGRRLREALKQIRLRPLRLGHEAAILFAIRGGHSDAIPLESLGLFQNAICKRLDEVETGLLQELESETCKISNISDKLREVIQSVRTQYTSQG